MGRAYKTKRAGPVLGRRRPRRGLDEVRVHLRRERYIPLKLRGKMERQLRAFKRGSWFEMWVSSTSGWWYSVVGENIALSALYCRSLYLSVLPFPFLPSVSLSGCTSSMQFLLDNREGDLEIIKFDRMRMREMQRHWK